MVNFVHQGILFFNPFIFILHADMQKQAYFHPHCPDSASLRIQKVFFFSLHSWLVNNTFSLLLAVMGSVKKICMFSVAASF